MQKIFDMIDMFYANKHLYEKVRKAQERREMIRNVKQEPEQKTKEGRK